MNLWLSLIAEFFLTRSILIYLKNDKFINKMYLISQLLFLSSHCLNRHLLFRLLVSIVPFHLIMIQNTFTIVFLEIIEIMHLISIKYYHSIMIVITFLAIFSSFLFM